MEAGYLMLSYHAKTLVANYRLEIPFARARSRLRMQRWLAPTLQEGHLCECCLKDRSDCIALVLMPTTSTSLNWMSSPNNVKIG
jgi:hypothetical protein